MRALDIEQFFWLSALAIVSSLTTLFIDITVGYLMSCKSLIFIFSFFLVKMPFKDNYFVWLMSSLLAVAFAQYFVNNVSLAASGSGIP